jgi:hypothetical protein
MRWQRDEKVPVLRWGNTGAAEAPFPSKKTMTA